MALKQFGNKWYNNISLLSFLFCAFSRLSISRYSVLNFILKPIITNVYLKTKKIDIKLNFILDLILSYIKTVILSYLNISKFYKYCSCLVSFVI